jgi:flagellar protein FliO/FliZ
MRFSHTLTRGVAMVGALTLLPAQAALAAGGESTPLHLGQAPATHAASGGGGGSGILRTIIALVVVVAVIYAVSRILRAVKGRDQRASGDGLKHLSTLPLGGGRSLALVRSGRDVVLVGIGEHGVTPIKTYTEAEAIANGIEIPDSSPSSAAGSASGEERPFGEVLDRLRKLTVRP